MVRDRQLCIPGAFDRKRLDGDMVRQFRKSMGWKQRQMAAALGVRPQTVYIWEKEGATGAARVILSLLIQEPWIAAYLGLPLRVEVQVLPGKLDKLGQRGLTRPTGEVK